MTSAPLVLGIIIISLTVGFLSFYLLSDLPKQEKKLSVEEVASQLMNFVIFIWLGKIVLNFSVFIKDPLAILAYPSNSQAFYVAALLSVITIVLKYKRNKIDIVPFITVFTHVFLISSFVYEFIQIVWNKNTYSITYMGLLAVLVVVLVVMRDRIAPCKLNRIVLVGWAVGTLVLALIMPIVMVFGYTIAPWFLIVVLIVFSGLLEFIPH